MRRTVLSTFLFVVILGLGCMGVAVPVSASCELAQTIARLIEDSDDGYVLLGLSANKYGDRPNGIGSGSAD